jgi:hypothetical protein
MKYLIVGTREDALHDAIWQLGLQCKNSLTLHFSIQADNLNLNCSEGVPP